MPKNLEKLKKKISKKKGNITSLNENSRDSQRLRRAGARGEKLEKLAAARAKANQPHMQRVSFFQGAAKASDGPIEAEKIQSLIQRYIKRDEEELVKFKAERRPGRASSTREDLLKQRVAMEEREYNSGFWMPDVENEQNLVLLREWNGLWTSLSVLKYVRIARDGTKHSSSFPPKGQS